MRKTSSIPNYFAKNVAIYAFLLLKTEEFGDPTGVKHLTKSTSALQKVFAVFANFDPLVYLSPTQSEDRKWDGDGSGKDGEDEETRRQRGKVS